MEIKEMTIEALEQRKAQIGVEIDNDGADLDALENEVKSINAELETRKTAAQKKVELRNAIANNKVDTITIKEMKEERKMENIIETRNTKEYIHAFANYVKTGDDKEVRSLLTENSTGRVPVPAFVEAEIKHAWETLGLLNLVKKTYLKGNVKVGFEISATGAVVHTEGTAAPTEETLTLGVTTLVPASIKKWITVSDEALDLTDDAFLTYVYQELAYQIGKKLEDEIIAKIIAKSATATATAVNVPEVEKAVAIDTILTAFALLGDEARDLTVVCNKATYAAIKATAKAAHYAQDPFDGYRVVFNNTLPAYATATAQDVYLILGDFGNGYQCNFPNSAEINIKFDELSLAEKDLVKIVGREFCGHDAVAPSAFVKVKKPA